MSSRPHRHHIRCFLRNRGEVLVVRQDDRWDAVSDAVKENPTESAHAVVGKLSGDKARIVREGTVLFIPGEKQDLYVHPFLFDCSSRADVHVSDTHEWIAATELLQRSTTPELWAAYAEVAPSVESIKQDRKHGASYLSIQALEVLRDWSGRLSWQQKRGQRLTEDRLKHTISQLATRLIGTKPTMAVLQNRVNKVMCKAQGNIPRIATLAHEQIRSAFEADDEAARRASQLVTSQNVLTFSSSDTVLSALSQCRPAATVFVSESLPGGEGVETARKLSIAGCDVTLLPDAATASLLAAGNIDLVLTGADTALPGGQIINKTGTHLIAIAAAAHDLPFYAVCSTEKISSRQDISLDEMVSEPLQEKAGPIDTYSPLFEAVPSHLISGIITEKGILTPEALEEIALSLAELEGWRDENTVA